MSSELPAKQSESHHAVVERYRRVVFTRSDHLKFAVVPDDDFARAIITFREGSLEQKVVERVVVDMNREALDLRILAWPLRHRPRYEGRPNFQSEVIMETPSPVLLNRESASRSSGPRSRFGDGWGGHADGSESLRFLLY